MVNKEGKRLRCSHWIPLPLGFKPVRLSNGRETSEKKGSLGKQKSNPGEAQVFGASSSVTAFGGVASTVEKRKGGNPSSEKHEHTPGRVEMVVDTSNQLEADSESYPCIVYLHSNAGCRLGSTDVLPLAASYCSSLFAFDFAGSGLSDGIELLYFSLIRSGLFFFFLLLFIYGIVILFLFFSCSSYDLNGCNISWYKKKIIYGWIGKYVSLGFHEQDDVDIVIRYLSNLRNVSRIVLWGRSMGAATSLLYGGKMGKIGKFFGSSHGEDQSFGLLCSSSLRYTETGVKSSTIKSTQSDVGLADTKGEKLETSVSDPVVDTRKAKLEKKGENEGDWMSNRRKSKDVKDTEQTTSVRREKKRRARSVKEKHAKTKGHGKSEKSGSNAKSRSHRDRSKSATTQKKNADEGSAANRLVSGRAITGTKYGTRRRSVLREGSKQRLSSVDDSLVALKKGKGTASGEKKAQKKETKDENIKRSQSDHDVAESVASSQAISEKTERHLSSDVSSRDDAGTDSPTGSTLSDELSSPASGEERHSPSTMSNRTEDNSRRDSPLRVPAARGVRVKASPETVRSKKERTSRLHKSDAGTNREVTLAVSADVLSQSEGEHERLASEELKSYSHRVAGEASGEPRQAHIVVGLVADSPFARLLPLVREMVNSACPKGAKSFVNSAASMTLKMLRQTIKKKANFDPRDVEPIHAAVIARLPLLLCHAEEDTIIPLHHAEDIFEAYGGIFFLKKILINT